MNEPKIEQIALGQLRPSKTNPRKHFDQAKLEELIESVRRKGIVQPLLVRPDWCMGKTEEEIGKVNGEAPPPSFYDIVAGERRYRAASDVQLATAPVIVQQLSDSEALELQLIENLQRADLTAVEEAEGYRQLMNLGYTVERIHERTGKTKRTIYGKLKLLSAPAGLLKAVDEGVVGARVAELVGRIPVAEMRAAAAKQILRPPYSSEPLNYRQAEELVRENFMRSLSAAAFDQIDASLVAVTIDDATGERIAGGACTDCPMKTGNSPELFGDVKRTDVCTNPKCFAAKSDVQFARVQESAAAEGKRVLSEKETAGLFEDNGRLWFDSDYVKLAESPDENEVSGERAKLPSWKKLLAAGSAKPQIVIARDPRGRVVELVKRAAAIEAVNLGAKERGEKSLFAGAARTAGMAARARDADAFKADQKRQRTLAKRRLALALAAMTELIGAIDGKGAVPGFWDALIETSITHAGHDGCWLICKRLGLDPKAENAQTKVTGVQGAALEYGLTLPDETLKLGFLVELLISQATKFSTANYGGGLKSTTAFTRFAKLYEIDLDAIEKQVKAAAQEEKKPARKKTKKRAQPEKGQSDVKAPAIGLVEHLWDKSSGKLVGSAGNKEFVCQRCGAIGVQLGTTWPPVLEKRFLEKACLPNEKKTRRKPSAATRAKIAAAVSRSRQSMKKGGVK